MERQKVNIIGKFYYVNKFVLFFGHLISRSNINFNFYQFMIY